MKSRQASYLFTPHNLSTFLCGFFLFNKTKSLKAKLTKKLDKIIYFFLNFKFFLTNFQNDAILLDKKSGRGIGETPNP